MNLLKQLAELDNSLFAELAKAEECDQDDLSRQLVARADLLQRVIDEGQVGALDANELISRSRRLKEAAEQLQQNLGEQLKKMQKGRRSVRAYQNVKKN